MDIKAYMQSVGREARIASRLMARAETAVKNQSLTVMAAAIKRDEHKLLTANALDLQGAKAQGLDAALIDRLTLTSKGWQAWQRVCCKSPHSLIRSAKSAT